MKMSGKHAVAAEVAGIRFGPGLSSRQQPIIVLQRRAKRPFTARSNTWKVAYADFITALMALFSVLWVLSNKPHSQQSIAQYFNYGEPVSTQGTLRPTLAPADLGALAEELRRAIELDSKLKFVRTQVEMRTTTDGLTIDLLENNQIPFFGVGKGDPTDTGTALLRRLAIELGKVPNRIVLEGHTDSKPYVGAETYNNWDLSTDRANAARRVMTINGLKPGQVSEILGSADQNPGVAETAGDSANRRVTIIVKELAASQAQEFAQASRMPMPARPAPSPSYRAVDRLPPVDSESTVHLRSAQYPRIGDPKYRRR